MGLCRVDVTVSVLLTFPGSYLLTQDTVNIRHVIAVVLGDVSITDA